MKKILIAGAFSILGCHLDPGKRWGLHLWTNPRFLLGSDDQSFIIDGHEHIHEKTTFFGGNGINVVYWFGWS